jgi:hypothetical protein
MLSRTGFCIVLSAASAAKAQLGPTAHMFGAGTLSCGAWQSSGSVEYEDWILGFWSGLNNYSITNRNVGQTTDVFGIISAVRKACADDPTLPVAVATVNVYARLAQEKR